MAPGEITSDNNQIGDFLCEVISRYGISVCDEPRKVKGLLLDLSLGENKKEINILIMLLDEKIPQDLLSGKDAIPYELLSNKASMKILSNHALDKSSVQWAINCWAFALQIINDPPPPPANNRIIDPRDIEQINRLIQSLNYDRNDGNRNQAARELRKYNDSRVIDALIQAVHNDAKVRFEALMSLSELKSEKALQIFIERLNDPSARIRRISILALGDIGDESAIEPLQVILTTKDFKNRSSRGRSNWGKAENVELAEDAINTIRKRLNIPRQEKTSPELTRYVKAGMNYNEGKEFENAVLEFDKELRNNPNNSLAIREKGFAFSNLGHYEQALQLLSLAIKLNPGDFIAWRHKGYIFSKYGKQYDAINCYDASLKINPNDSTTWRTKGFSLHKIKKYTESLDCYRRAIELDENEFFNWFLASKVFRDMHQFEEEIRYLKKALQIDNQAYYCVTGIGWAYVNLNQIQQGLQCFETVLNIDKNNQAAWKGRSVCLRKLSQHTQSTINPNPLVKNNEEEGLLKRLFPFLK